ncbi:MAG: hypothetical protein OHK0015_50650 [Chloroflexi bacterium OHK40]
MTHIKTHTTGSSALRSGAVDTHPGPSPEIEGSERGFARTLKQQRKRHDLTQTELAHLVGCASVTIQRFEQGTLRPSRQIAERMAAIFALAGEERELFVRLARGRPLAEPDIEAPHLPAIAAVSLPTPLTPLIGRAQEVALVCQALMGDTVRWLTLMGPGGIGKTRVALQAAAELAPSFPDGVVFVDLAPIRDATLVPGAIAAALGLPDPKGSALLQRLQTALQSRRLLLVLDNFEQVATAAIAVSALLKSAPSLKVLVTSRALLAVSGEHRVEVPPLAYPDPALPTSPERLAEYEAVRLFMERARALQPESAAWDDAAAVAAICARLDGIPLAIELAAARVALFPPQALLEQLDHCLPLLTGGPRDLPPRQQTLRNTLAWSYGLITPPLQRLFARLGVFVGGWSLAAAAAVCDPDGDLGVNVVDGLAALVNHSLVRRIAGPAGEVRFTMLTTIREYALERLAESGQLDTLRWQHARYCLRLAREAERGLMGAEQLRWLRRLDTERDNLLAVLTWPEQGYPHETNPGIGAAMVLALAGTLWHYWVLRGSDAEWLRWLPDDLGAVVPGAELLPPAIRDRLWARALLAPAALSIAHGDYPSTRTLAARSSALFRAADEPWGEAAALALLGAATAFVYPVAGGRALLAESLWRARAQGDPWLIAWCLLYTGFELLSGDAGPAEPELAHVLLEECLVYARQSGDAWLIAWALNHLGRSALVRGELERAVGLFEETLAIRRQLQDRIGIAWSLGQLGIVAQELGDYARVLALNEERYSLEQQLGNVLGMSAVRYAQAIALGALGRSQEALHVAAESVALARQMDDQRRIALCMLLQGQMALQAAAYGQAQACLEACLPIAEAVGDWRLGAWVRLHLGAVAYQQGEHLLAAGWSQEALDIFHGHADRHGTAASLIQLAAIRCATGSPEVAAGLLAAASHLSQSGDARLEPAQQVAYEQTCAAARAELGATRFGLVWARGQARCLESTVAEALARATGSGEARHA